MAWAVGVLAVAAGLAACSSSSSSSTDATPTTGNTTGGCAAATTAKLYPSREAEGRTMCVAGVECEYANPGFSCGSDGGEPAEDCLTKPSPDALDDPPCLRGTWKLVQSTTEKPNSHTTVTTNEPVDVEFSLWALKAKELVGAAHLTHSVRDVTHDTQATGCRVQTSVVDEASWDVSLEGMYLVQPDGRVQVIARAKPPQGPELTERFPGCPIPDRTLAGVSWPAVSAVLVQGVADVRQPLPTPQGAAGESSLAIHVDGPGG